MDNSVQSSTGKGIQVVEGSVTSNIYRSSDEGEETVTFCDLCRKSFHGKEDIRSHSTFHLSKTKAVFDCFMCGKNSLHIKSVKRCILESGENANLCKGCVSKDSVKARIVQMYKVVPYECGFCQKECKQKNHLIDHVRVHTGEKPYQCECCGKGFAVSSSLAKHMRKHTGERPHSCDVCGRSFLSRAHLQRHGRIHSGEKPFQCNTCGNCFRQINTLYAHMRTHTGVKPHSCNLCDKRFSDKRSLHKHKDREHTMVSNVMHSEPDDFSEY